MNQDTPNDFERAIVERFNSVNFKCILCDNPEPLTKSEIKCVDERLDIHGLEQPKSEKNEVRSTLYVTAFLFCPQCKSKFSLKMLNQDEIKQI
jgi:hypothetical protein